MTRIKVCGLKRFEDIDYVNEALPDYCGFIVEFPKSSRCVGRRQVRELVSGLDRRVIPVGVFVDAPEELPAQLLNDGVIKIAQLHGSEDEEYIKRLRSLTDGRIIKAFSIKLPGDVRRASASSADYILLDQGGGGTGKPFDWSLAENIERPFFLAGGLDAENLKTAITRLKPWAVDLSSSLETGGVKDRDKIIKAVEAVRDYDRRK